MLTAVLTVCRRPRGSRWRPRCRERGRAGSRRAGSCAPARPARRSARRATAARPAAAGPRPSASAGNASIGDHHRTRQPSRASTRSTVPSGRRSHSSAGVLPAGRAADQRLPQDQRLAPRLGDAGRYALAAQAGDGRQQGLRHVILRRARPVRGVASPTPATGCGKTFRGKAGSPGRPSSSRPGSIAGQGGGGGAARARPRAPASSWGRRAVGW